ncbi:MAG: polyprenyl synthetase family protein, partial [Planctomycetia bacterium]|nr:polyprenyl synthetase family protein [Planctomycetia bacterium]
TDKTREEGKNGKTAEISPENQKKIENAALFGRNIGMAFQIADDLLDILGDEEQMGKTLGSDLAKQKLTLPIIRLLNVLDVETRDALITEIQNHLGPETYTRIRTLLQEYHIYESVRETAIGHITHAVELLDIFPDSPAKSAMVGFAKYAIERQQ